MFKILNLTFRENINHEVGLHLHFYIRHSYMTLVLYFLFASTMTEQTILLSILYYLLVGSATCTCLLVACPGLDYLVHYAEPKDTNHEG